MHRANAALMERYPPDFWFILIVAALAEFALGRQSRGSSLLGSTIAREPQSQLKLTHAAITRANSDGSMGLSDI